VVVLALAPAVVALAPVTPATAAPFWTTLPMKPTAVQFLAVGAGARVYAIGGYHNGFFATAEKYDPATSLWTTLSPMPTPRSDLAAAAFGGNVYAVGGLNGSGYLSTLERYNVASNSWATLASMPTARRLLAAAAAPCARRVAGTCLYAIGGYNGVYLNTVEEYNPSTNTWTTLANMPTARSSLAAAAGAHVYAVGGYDGGTNLATLEQYNPPTDTWATLPNMLTARGYLAAAAFGGNVYAVGGINNSKAALSTLERYNVASNTWATLPNMPTARFALAAAAAPCHNSKVTCLYAVAGTDGTNDLGTLEAFG
jgi:N-acetylneuraminic acid mutarotase